MKLESFKIINAIKTLLSVCAERLNLTKPASKRISKLLSSPLDFFHKSLKETFNFEKRPRNHLMRLLASGI